MTTHTTNAAKGNEGAATSPRLEILKRSLEKKERLFDQKLDAHFSDVKSANGQPLNDKSNGSATMSRWERQDNGLRSIKQSIEKTKLAIEREEEKIGAVMAADTPDFLQAMVAAGELKQWRKHPETFFVTGVDKGRIVWDAKSKTIFHRYWSEVPKDQRPLFIAAFNKANAAVRALHESSAIARAEGRSL